MLPHQYTAERQLTHRSFLGRVLDVAAEEDVTVTGTGYLRQKLSK